MSKSAKPKSLGKLAVLQQQVDELTKALQHERADAENMRRRHEQQIGELRDMVKANVVSELLPAIDNLERALKHVPKDLEGNDYVNGVQATVKQFEKTLSDIGAERIRTVGEVFNPNLHDAMQVEDDGGQKEIIVEELQAGYKLGDQIIRHALVKVRKIKSKEKENK